MIKFNNAENLNNFMKYKWEHNNWMCFISTAFSQIVLLLLHMQEAAQLNELLRQQWFANILQR